MISRAGIFVSSIRVFQGKLGFKKTAALVLSSAVLSGCATVPFDQPKTYSEVITDTADTSLGRDVARWLQAHDGLSGFYPLSQGMDALGIRLQLAERAEKSIDLQYFLMKNDTAGAVLINLLLKSADRGVRVRFLLDDIFTEAHDRTLLLLNQHANIEVRLFNPISRSGISGLNFLTSFKQANRRMHNKSFTVDNQASVVGGRNIADEYFQLKHDNVFEDFDVLAIGPIAGEVSRNFDQYWNHSHAVPIDYFASNKKNEDLETARAEIAEVLNQHPAVYANSFLKIVINFYVKGQGYPSCSLITSSSFIDQFFFSWWQNNILALVINIDFKRFPVPWQDAR